MFYALVGIPVTSLMLASAGEIITLQMDHIVTNLERKVLKKEIIKHKSQKIFILSFILFLAILNFAAMFLVLKNKWRFLKAFYFWFITFTTIGFGDLDSPIVAQITAVWALILIAIFVRILSIAGVCSLAGVVNSAVEITREINKRRRQLSMNRQSSLFGGTDNLVLGPVDVLVGTIDKESTKHKARAKIKSDIAESKKQP